MITTKTVATGVAALLGLTAVVAFGSSVGSSSYVASVTLDSATGVVKGAPVRVDGFKAGSVQDIEVVDGKAKVTFSLTDEFAPLHDGATAVIGWRATLSERQLEVTDGGDDQAGEIPDGGMLRASNVSPVEVDDILNALDEPTRENLKGTVAALRTTLAGAEGDVNAAIASAGPALGELSEVLKAVGTDGPAISSLVTRADDLLGVLASRQEDVQAVVTELDAMTETVAQRRTELRDTLTALPGTLDQATSTVGQVPATVDAVSPLLQDLGPATQRLSTVATDLGPLLTDLRPLVNDLRPTLASADGLLDIVPGLLDSTDVVLPSATSLIESLRTPVGFLRPYTPEVTAFFSTWASAFANYDSNGNFARIFAQQGTTSFNENPGIVPPGVAYDPYPQPGAVVGQTWTDAAGGELR